MNHLGNIKPWFNVSDTWERFDSMVLHGSVLGSLNWIVTNVVIVIEVKNPYLLGLCATRLVQALNLDDIQLELFEITTGLMGMTKLLAMLWTCIRVSRHRLARRRGAVPRLEEQSSVFIPMVEGGVSLHERHSVGLKKSKLTSGSTNSLHV
jgi:hypothetical protein